MQLEHQSTHFIPVLWYHKMMIISKYTNATIPDHFKWQILSFQRIQWPDGFVGENLDRTWIARPSFQPIHFVLSHKDILISHVCIVSVSIVHSGNTYAAKGLSGVFTYPSFRMKGHGLRLVRECVAYIKKQKDVDLAIHPSKIKGFYEKAGFEQMKHLRLTYGSRKHPSVEKETPYLILLSKRTKRNYTSFNTGTMYIGKHMW